MPYIVSLSAIAGGGKTTVTNLLTGLLNNTAILSFDSYKGDLLGCDYCEWSERGADYNEWHLEPLINDIEKLSAEGYNYILLDYPFGYGNVSVRKFIDLAVFIDTPLDIALARRIIRDYTRRDSSRRAIDDKLGHMDNTLSYYIECHRNTFIKHRDTVMPYCDLIVDGMMTPIEIAKNIADKILSGSK